MMQPSGPGVKSAGPASTAATAATIGSSSMLQPQGKVNKLITPDLDASLATIAGNLSMNPTQQFKK